MRCCWRRSSAFYGAAAVGRRAGRLAGVARTFVVLNAAALVGPVALPDRPPADHLVSQAAGRATAAGL